jgi:hypothetical protein
VEHEAAFVAAEGVVAQAVGDETVLLDLGSGTYYSLNGSASVVWHALEGGGTVGTVIETLLDHFDVDGEQAAEDAARLIGEAVERGLLEPQ